MAQKCGVFSLVQGQVKALAICHQAISPPTPPGSILCRDTNYSFFSGYSQGDLLINTGGGGGGYNSKAVGLLIGVLALD